MVKLICDFCQNERIQLMKLDDGTKICSICQDKHKALDLKALDVEIPDSFVWISSPAKQGKHRDGTVKKLFIVPKKLSDFIGEGKKYSIVVKEVRKLE